MSRTEEARLHVVALRARLERARAAGQVELHLDLGTVDLLVTIAELALGSPQGESA